MVFSALINLVETMGKRDLGILLSITNMEGIGENSLNVRPAILDSPKGIAHSSLGYIQKSPR